jgi:hypothetical protein
MLMSDENVKKKRSNVANGTSQVGINDLIHGVMTHRSKLDRRSIRATYEMVLSAALGFESLEALEACGTVEEVIAKSTII